MFSKNFSGEKGLQKFFSGILHVRKTKKSVRKISARFLAFFNKILTVQKIVLSSSRGQSNFLRTLGFEAKAKDFKMCPRGRPRGQGRPRGLHL